MTNPWRIAALAAVAALFFTGVVPVQAAGFAQHPAFAQPALALTPNANAAASAYCTSTGGAVERRKPVFGTNNPPSQQLVLAGEADFCHYTQKKGGASIFLLLTTLVAKQPTLAALAYYAKAPTQNATCPGGANPASCYCTYLGGSDQFGGTNAAGGAWVLKGSPFEDLETCIFPDLSSIDSWGLAYHANNIIRGIDLAKVLQYHNPNH